MVWFAVVSAFLAGGITGGFIVRFQMMKKQENTMEYIMCCMVQFLLC